MIKNLFTLLICLFSGCMSVMAQRTSDQLPSNPGSTTINGYWYTIGDTTGITGRQLWLYAGNGKSDRIPRWNDMRAYVSAAAPTISGFTVLQQPSVGTVIAPGTSVDAAFKQLFAPPQNPTASLTPTTTILELVNATTAPTETGNFTYTYGKNAGTSNIATAAINGSQGGIIQNPNGTSGSITKTWNVNTTTTYTLLVTTIDSKTAQSVATVLYQPKIYVGTCAGTTPTQSEVLSATTKTFATGRAYNMNFTFTGSNLHVFYAYPATFGTVTSVKDAAGNQAINAETLSSLSLTNDRGFVQTYNTATTNNTYSNANIVLSFL